MSFLPSSLLLPVRFTGNGKRLQNSGFEVCGVRQMMALKRGPNVRLGDLFGLPGPVEVFEPFAGKAFLGEISENEVGFTEGPVLVQIPGFANREVTQQIVGG